MQLALVKLLADKETERQWLLDGAVQHLPLLEARFAQLALMEGARRSLTTLPAIAYNLVRELLAGGASGGWGWGWG